MLGLSYYSIYGSGVIVEYLIQILSGVPYYDLSLRNKIQAYSYIE